MGTALNCENWSPETSVIWSRVSVSTRLCYSLVIRSMMSRGLMVVSFSLFECPPLIRFLLGEPMSLQSISSLRLIMGDFDSLFLMQSSPLAIPNALPTSLIECPCTFFSLFMLDLLPLLLERWPWWPRIRLALYVFLLLDTAPL